MLPAPRSGPVRPSAPAPARRQSGPCSRARPAALLYARGSRLPTPRRAAAPGVRPRRVCRIGFQWPAWSFLSMFFISLGDLARDHSSAVSARRLALRKRRDGRGVVGGQVGTAPQELDCNCVIIILMKDRFPVAVFHPNMPLPLRLIQALVPRRLHRFMGIVGWSAPLAKALRQVDTRA